MTSTPNAAPARRQRVYLVGYYGVANLGDEAIRHAIERAARLLDVDVVAFASRSADPDPRAVRTGFRNLQDQVRAIRGVDRVVLGGGGILKDEGLRLPLELLATAGVARLAGKRVTLLGVGVGPFYRRLGRLLVAAVARLSHVRTVRDAASAAALRELGVGRVLTGADPIFSTDSGPDGHPTRTPNGTAAAPADAGTRAVVSIRPWFHKLDEPAREAAIGALRAGLARGLKPLVAAGWSLDLVALYWPRDRDAAADLRDALDVDASPGEQRDLVHVAAGPTDWDGLGAAVGVADLVVAMRYHAVAAAALAGRPTVAIAYEPKVASLAADLAVQAIAVDDPELGSTLAAMTTAAAAGRLPAPPDEAAIQALRDRSWAAIRAALLD